jgi:hypothetical protein
MSDEEVVMDFVITSKDEVEMASKTLLVAETIASQDDRPSPL